MPKQLNINLAFTADTNAAKQQLKSLEQDLKNLVSATGATKDFKLTKDLVQAKEAAGQLRLALQNATTSTGSLDLSKFDQAIKASGMKLSEYRQHLSALGPAGQQAFAKMAQSIIQAEVPLRKTNALLDNLKTTMINTARWQLSSSMLHGFMGAVKSAYGYAQDLNSSLNNIRIVTGASVDEMTAFADRANKAAQALSTSTTAYTDAALIYYQQGIRDQEEIANRTETTIKMANVSRQSAEEVSQQMTAIWNNFYDGSKSLEYYADAITALGATTASSSQEIATGLEKFAAISKTVGLSYEYATAALATITAQTRQSADTVGTGLRTLFSRLEGLKLGETLEDGVDLNKYSQALDAVGVQVLDVSGELRNMDDILDDLGERWGDLTQAQKVALAQTVGGVRQYTNLIALMDNWETMQQNVLTAQGAEGTLQKQADIYAESWEAAQKRVKAAAQALYSDLLDDKFFIGLSNAFAKILESIDSLIDGIGGLRTIIPGLILLFNQLWGKQMAQNIDNMIFNMSRNTDAMQKQIAQQKQQAYDEASAMFKGSDTNMGRAQEQALKNQLDLSFQLQGAAKKLTAEEIQRYQASIDTVSAIQDQVIALGKAADAAAKAKDAQVDTLTNKAIRSGRSVEEKQSKLDQSQADLQAIDKQVTASTNASKALQKLNEQYSNGEISALGYAKAIKGIQADLRAAGFDRYGASVQTLQKAVNAAKTSTEAFDAEIKKIVADKGFENNAYIDTITHMESLADKYGWTADDCERYLNIVHQNIEAGMEFSQAEEIAAEAVEKLRAKIASAESAMQTLGTTGQTIVQIFSGMSQFMMGLSSIVNVFETLANPDVSGLEKFKTVIMGLGMGLPMLIKGGQSLVGTFTAINTAIEGATAAQIANTTATEADTIVSGKNLVVKGMMKAAELLQIGLLRLRLGAQAALTAAEGGSTVATWLLTAAVNALNLSLTLSPVGLLIAALVALVAVIGVVVGVAKGLSALWNADANAAAKAAEAASQLKDKYNETRQAYEDLKSSITDHENAVESIKDLERGTLEWRDAIRDANTQALELIDTLDLVQGQDYYIDKDGLIQFKDGVLEEAMEAESQKVNQAQANSIMADQTARNAQIKSDQTDLRRSAWGSGVDVDKAIERLTSGDLAEGFAKNNLTDEVLKQELNIDDDELLASIKELAASINQNTDMQQMASEQAAQAILQGNEKVQNSGYADDINQAAGKIYDEAYQKAYEGYMNVKAPDMQANMKDKYLEEIGAKDLNGFKETSKGYSYVDENGQRQKVEVTQEEIAATLAAAEAEEKLAAASDGLVDQFHALDKEGSEASQAMKGFLSEGDFSGTSSGKRKELQSAVDEAGGTEAYLAKTLGDGEGDFTDEEAQALGYESAAAFVEAFEAGLESADEDYENAGKDILPKYMQEAFDAVSDNADISANGKAAIAEAVDSAFEIGGNDAAKSLMNQFMEAAEAGELTDEKIEEIIASAEELQAVDLEGLTNQIAEVNSIINGLSTGDSISADDYAKLSEEQQSYFAMAMDGTYQLIGSAEDLKAAAEEVNFDKFRELSGQAAETTDTFTSAANIGAENLDKSAYNMSTDSFDTELLETQLGLIQEFQEELGISNAELAEWQEAVASGMIDPNSVQDIANAVGELNLSEEELAQKAEEAAAKQTELQTAMALTASNTNELQEMLDNGEIGAEAFNKGMEKLHNTLDEDIDKEQYEELSEYFEEFGDEIKGVSKDMKGNKKAARELAKEISRFDAAVESVGENYDDWMKDLKKGDKNSTTHAKTIKGLRNAYGDLLDVSGDTLSKNFLENAENLDLMARAAKGDEEAYNQLQDAVRQDIAAQAHFDDTEFQNNFDNLLSKYYEGQNLDDIEVGADLNNADFLNGLTEMVNAAGMTAQQATDYLASMGVDAEVIETSAPSTETTEVVGYSAQAHTATQSYSIPKVSGSGENMDVSTTTGTASFPYFTVSEDVNTVTTTKDNKATSLKVTSASKSSGGGFKFNNSSAGGGGGGGCFLAGTLISTINGLKPIEKIQPGDIVLSYNEQSKQNEYSEVLQTMIHYLWTDVYTVNVNNENIKVTGVHRFYIKRAGVVQWIPASELCINDLMYLASGEWKHIDKIIHKKTFRKVYNFEVSGNHNYYVTESQILAHNKGGCFIAGTLVTTEQGFEKIENIQPGDIVLSYNEITKQNEYSKVLDTMIHRIWTDLYSLYIENEVIKVTEIHRFYILRDGQVQWIPASEIQILDLVLFADGTWHQIDHIEKKRCFRKVYNFEVSNNHNYYVSKAQVLVHNKGCFVAHTLISTNQGFKKIEDIQIGDIVLSYDEQQQQNVYSEVAETMIHFVQEPIYSLYIANEVLKVTGIHRFFIKRDTSITWRHAEDLQEGDLVLFADGTWHQIFKITKQFRFRKVYNFEVSNTHNYYVGQNQILAHNKRRGGGRRAERQTKTDYKTGEDAGERYHVIQQKLTSLTAAYDKVSAAADRAFGKDKIKLLNQQIKAQDKLIEAQKEYVKEIKANIKEDTKNLSYKGKQTYYSEVDGKKKTVDVSANKYLGIALDIDEETGAINNYDKLIEAANKKYNAKLDWYNKLSAANQEKDSTKLAMEKNEQEYEGFMKMLEQYEETMHLYEDESQKLQDLKNEKYDLQLDKIDIEVNYKIDIQDDKLKIVDLLLQQIEDDASKAAERIGLIGKQATIAESKMKTYRQGIQAIFTAHDDVSEDEATAMMNQLLSGNSADSIAMLKDKKVKLTEKEVDQLRSYSDGLLEETNNLMEYRKEVVQEISNVMDDNIEKMDRINNKMEKLKTVTNSYKNLVDLTGKKYLKISSNLYDSMEKTNVQLGKQSLENAKTQKKQAEDQLDYLNKKYAKVVNELSDAEKKEWEDRIKEAEDYVDEMTTNFYSSWEEALEAVSTRFESAMSNMASDFSEAMGGSVKGVSENLEGLQYKFDLKKTVEEVYLPDYERIYQLTKLTRDAQKEIDSATNVKVKKELQGVQEKILTLQQSGEKVSKYELEYLQKELELKKAQLALEEASEVKSQVRMSRDSEGNFSYVYTANQGAVEDAEAEYANKLYEMQKLNEEYINDMQSQIIQMEQDYTAALQEAADMYGVGTTEYYNALLTIQENYDAFFQNLDSELNLALQNQDETQSAHAALYVALTGDTLQAAAQVTTQWEETTLASLTGFTSATGYANQWKEASEAAYNAAVTAADNWKNDTESIYTTAGTTTEQFATNAATQLNTIKKESDDLGTSFKTTATDAETSFESAVDAVVKWEQQHSEKIQAAIESNKALIESINDIIKAWEGASSSIEAIHDIQLDSINAPASTTVAATTATTSTKSAFQTAIEKKAASLAKAAVRGLRKGRKGSQTRKRYDAAYRAAYDKALRSLARNASKKAKNARTVKAATRALTRKVIRKARTGLKKAAKKAYRKRYDTGGYTGDWAGNGGKEAILHKKELVLNAKDTENMLKTVDMVRAIASMINLNAISSSGGLSQLNAPGAPITAGKLDQQVTITAEFPNATDRNEILSAFDNVINLASQYANR